MESPCVAAYVLAWLGRGCEGQPPPAARTRHRRRDHDRDRGCRLEVVAERAAELGAAGATRTRSYDDRVRALFRGDPDERIDAATHRDARFRVADQGRDPCERPFSGGQLRLLADDMGEHEAELEPCRECGREPGGGQAAVRLDDTADEGPLTEASLVAAAALRDPVSTPFANGSVTRYRGSAEGVNVAPIGKETR